MYIEMRGHTVNHMGRNVPGLLAATQTKNTEYRRTALGKFWVEHDQGLHQGYTAITLLQSALEDIHLNSHM